MNGELSIQKRTVTELTDDEMFQIDGGTTPLCFATVLLSVIVLTITPGCEG